MVFQGPNDLWHRYPRPWATARPPRLPRRLPFILRENSKTRRAFRRGFRKAEDAGLLAQVKDDNAAKGVPERPAGMRALVERRYKSCRGGV